MRSEDLESWGNGRRVVVTCLKCGIGIFSAWSGHLATCKCGACSVDETEYYARINGDRDHYKTEVRVIEFKSREEE